MKTPISNNILVAVRSIALGESRGDTRDEIRADLRKKYGFDDRQIQSALDYYDSLPEF